MTAKTYRIEDDTPIMPCIVADCVIEEAERAFKLGLPDPRGVADKLADRQAMLYQNSARWRKKMRAKGNRGRDLLYTFMRHWLAAELKDSHPAASRKLADAACYGYEVTS